MRTIIIIALVGAAIFFLFVQYTGTTDDVTAPTNDEPVATTSAATTWNTYEDSVDEGLDFSLQYPAAATVSQVQDTIYEIKFIGPNSEPNTEITDGYYISLRFLDEDYADVLDEVEPVDGLATSTFQDYPAQTYDSVSGLGSTVAHTVVDVGSYTLDIGVTISGADTAAYEREVDRILASLNISTTTTNTVPAEVQAQIDDMSDQITLTTPAPLAEVASPISLRGEARGTWLFEATAPVVVTNWDGEIVGEGYIEADGNWMTEDFVPIAGEISYSTVDNPVSASGTLILQKANPSGLPENDAALEIPIILN